MAQLIPQRFSLEGPDFGVTSKIKTGNAKTSVSEPVCN